MRRRPADSYPSQTLGGLCPGFRKNGWGFTVSGQFSQPVASPLRILSRVFLCQPLNRSLAASSVFIIPIAGAVEMSRLGAKTTLRLLSNCPWDDCVPRQFLSALNGRPSDGFCWEFCPNLVTYPRSHPIKNYVLTKGVVVLSSDSS